jgi:endonuclease/exonuclease/phosphatase (EEP) superfamily protein YafD
VLAAAVTASRWLDVAWAPLAQAQSLVPWAAVVAGLALLGVLLPGRGRHRAGLSALCLVVLALHGAIWLPWLTAEDPGAGRGLTVMALNVYKGRADLDAVARLVRAERVDVLVLSEVRPAAWARIEAHPVGRLLPNAVPRRPSSAESTVILSREPLVARATSRAVPDEARPRHPVATVLGHGRPVVAVGVHPSHPASAATVTRWRATLRGLTVWAASTRGPLVVAGDFNASVDHPGMRALLGTGLRDAHEVTGAGRPPTWPYGKDYPAFVHIDHVLVRGLGVVSADDVRIPGSDHDAVVADLVVPGRPMTPLGTDDMTGVRREHDRRTAGTP